MKQFRHIFRFEYQSYVCNKVFIGLTAVLILLMACVLFYPRVTADREMELPSFSDTAPKTLAVASACAEDAAEIAGFLQASLPNTAVTAVPGDLDALKAVVQAGSCDAAILLVSPVQYQYITQTGSLTDTTAYTISDALSRRLQLKTMAQYGLDETQAQTVMTAAVTAEPVVLGNDQNQTFFYTYILMFLLYFAVLMYGQFVAQSVATEKSSRAMELLITSAKPVNLMFGKVLGSGAAGLTQLVLLLGSAFTFYSVNKSYWSSNAVMESVFGMPAHMIAYTVLFFVLGFLLYSFLYGALASLASRLEDVNTLIMPVTFLMIIAFMVTMFSMIGDVDSPLMKVASYIPFTSPLAMFTRIAMGHVEPFEIVISVAVLLVSTVGVGYLAAAIYRVGVLMYGKPPRFNELLRALRQNRAKKI